MKRLNEEKDYLFIAQYLYNKLKHVGKFSFYMNFSDISYDLRPFIEANYFDYINVNYEEITDSVSIKSRDVIKRLNMLHRSYINKYTWVRRDALLDILKQESKEDYYLRDSIKSYLIENGIRNEDLMRIDNRFKEWKTLNALSIPNNKSCINADLAIKIKRDIGPKIASLNLNDDNEFNYNFNVVIKSKRNRNYYSGRAYNDVCYTRNDLEEKRHNYWEKVIEDNRENRSAYFNELEKEGYYIIDLGDMSSNFPNMLNCIKTGIYEDKDFHSVVAAENGISRSIAKMASVRCCFNCRKIDILYGLLDNADVSKLSNEIKVMDKSGIFLIKDDKISLKRGRKLTEAHEFFNSRKENAFFSYCNDFLTSWDACHNIYKNDLAPSDLSMLTSAVEVNVIYDAHLKGYKIINAFDHAYLITKNKDDYYDWKGEYKKTAERLVKYYYSNTDEVVQVLTTRNSAALKGKIGVGIKKGTKNALKEEVRNYLKETNYDIEAAAKHFNWKPQWKYYWKKLIKEHKI